MAESVQIKSVSWRHEALADLMITKPYATLGEIAKELGFTLSWVSIVKNSDAFKDYWTLRRRVHADAVTSGIKEKAAALAEMSLDILIEATEAGIASNSISASEARDNLELVTKRFGFDGSASQQSHVQQVQLNIGIASAEALASAREKMRRIEPSVPLAVIEDGAGPEKK